MGRALAADQARVGSVLAGKYRLLRLLGRGGTATVYEAENTWTGRHVAVKLLRGELISDGHAKSRFMQEARTASQIAHPNIVDVLDMGEDPGTGVYMVQEYLQGVDLRRWLREHPGPVGLRDALDIVVPIMGALVEAHDRGIVHRDLKPENVFLSRGPRARIVPKLIDFGISKIVGRASEATQQLDLNTVVGTPRYMSPEQLEGDRSIDGRTDVWSIGVVLYEMLTGRPALPGATDTEVVDAILEGRLPQIATRLPASTTLPAGVAETLHRALERDRDRRYPSMRAFLDAWIDCPAFVEDPPERSLAIRHKDAIWYLPDPSGLRLRLKQSGKNAQPPPSSMPPRVTAPIGRPPAEAPERSSGRQTAPMGRPPQIVDDLLTDADEGFETAHAQRRWRWRAAAALGAAVSLAGLLAVFWARAPQPSAPPTAIAAPVPTIAPVAPPSPPPPAPPEPEPTEAATVEEPVAPPKRARAAVRRVKPVREQVQRGSNRAPIVD